MDTLKDALKEISQSVVDMNEALVVSKVQELLTLGVDPMVILTDGLMAGMDSICEKFKRGESYIPEVLLSAQVMDRGIALLTPLLMNGRAHLGVVVLGTVEGDLHDIGKKLVAMLLGSAGFKVIDLGVDVSWEKFVMAVREYQPDILGMSALLTLSMRQMRKVIKGLQQAGLRDKVKVIVGGAPVSDLFAQKVQADGFADDALKAVDLCKSILRDK